MIPPAGKYDPERDTPDTLSPLQATLQSRLEPYRKARGVDAQGVRGRLGYLEKEGHQMAPSLYFAIERGDRLLTKGRAETIAALFKLSVAQLVSILQDEQNSPLFPDSDTKGFSKREKFGTALKCARTEKGWTQVRLAQEIKMKQSYLCLLEKRTDVPRPETVMRLANALGVPWQYLVPQHLSSAASVAMIAEYGADIMEDQKLLDELADVL